jgi:uncharacterized protein with von Willebrand factor type A (vWA) domain
MASELGEWHQLRLMTARNGFAAGIAAEVMLDKLLPLVPEAPPASETPGASDTPNNPPPRPPPGQADGTASDIRAALRRAAREARDAVQEAESAIEGLGPCMPGNEFVQKSGPANLAAIRDAHERLKNSPRLQRIAQLAGRLERVAASKAMSKVKPGVGEVHGIGPGDDIARLLPSELVALRRPKLKLALLARIAERSALTYEMTGREPQARGPVIVLMDESSSMREGGKDIWSKAVALALLSTATKQRRAWHLVAFNGNIRREIAIAPGRATPADVQAALDEKCGGGTDFDAPVLRAIEIIRTSRTMKAADVVVITDGEDEMEPETIEAATGLIKIEGVSWFVVAVGSNGGETCAASLGPIATSIVHVGRCDETGNDLVVPVINLDRREGT